MRVLALHEDAIVFVSAFWQTTCTAVRAADEGFLVDSPVLPHELEALPQILEQAGFPVSALLCTHGDWDHLLGRMAFPGASLGAGASTGKRLSAEPGQAQRALRDFDAEHYVERPAPLSLEPVQELPLPGRLDLGPERELELLPADGHTADGMALWMGWLELLVCGDYLSPVEIPMLSPGGSPDAYLATLGRLEGYVARAQTVVPGHGTPLGSARALELLSEDRTYLQSLVQAGASAELPAGRRGRQQRRIHEENVVSLSARDPERQGQ